MVDQVEKEMELRFVEPPGCPAGSAEEEVVNGLLDLDLVQESVNGRQVCGHWK